jgi:hypothetical protein
MFSMPPSLAIGRENLPRRKKKNSTQSHLAGGQWLQLDSTKSTVHSVENGQI